MSADLVVDVKDLRIERDGTVLVDALDLRIERGQNWAILGPNGCGKTSLLRALTGYLPGRGEIQVLGQRYGSSDWRELRTRVGLVSHSLVTLIPQSEKALATVVSGRDASFGTWSEPSEAELEGARAILVRVGCEHIAARPWNVLSQGERQRVLIGRALMSNPALMLLDEPCSGLDPVARERFLAFLDQLASRPDAPALVLVTHHLEEITPAFGHVLLLADGRVIGSGKKEDVLTDAVVSRAFDEELSVRLSEGRYFLRFGA